MLLIVGSLVVLGSVIGGYAAPGGHLGVLFQPFEFIIIAGAAVGGFIIANPKSVLKRTGKGFGKMLKGPKYSKKSYLELLSLLLRIGAAAGRQVFLETGQAPHELRLLFDELLPDPRVLVHYLRVSP